MRKLLTQCENKRAICGHVKYKIHKRGVSENRSIKKCKIKCKMKYNRAMRRWTFRSKVINRYVNLATFLRLSLYSLGNCKYENCSQLSQ